MDQQNNPRPVLTPEEIARLEAEAVAAIQRGEAPSLGETPSLGEAPSPDEALARPEPAAQPETDTQSEAAPRQPDFVPYVDDVPPAPKPDTREDAPEDDEDYIPSPWEELVNALSDKQWRWVQIVGGALLGLAALAILYIGSEELATYRMVVAALLALLLPRYIERVIRRDLVVARRAMIVALLAGLAITFLVVGAQHGFRFTKAQ